MKIALLGAPGSGKSKLAEDLARKVSAYVIDGYVKDIEGEYGIPVEHFLGSYISNIHVASYRILQESHAAEYGRVITCGTIIETLIYQVMWTRLAWEVNRDPDNQIRGEIALGLLASLLRDTWDYDFAYYLPSNGKGDEREWLIKEVNINIPVALQEFGIDYKTIGLEFTTRDAAREIIESTKTE